MAESIRIAYKRGLTHNIEKEAVAFPNSRKACVVRLIHKNITPQVTPQVETLLSVMNSELMRTESQEKLQLMGQKNFKENYLKPALEWDLIEISIPAKPTSSFTKNRLALKGKTVKAQNTTNKTKIKNEST